jgi:uncharacterized protein YjbI with pentapeptide repeats
MPTRAEHVALLKQDVTAWNEWRAKNRKMRPNLLKAQLSKANLSGADLSRVSLRQACLREADLTGANLSQTTLSGAYLLRAKLRRANLSGATLHEAFLSRANLSGANLSWASFHRANLSGADLSRADLSGANLREAHLRRASLSGANLSGVDLSRADLREAHLRRANLSWANLEGASLTEADLTGADLTGCHIYGVSAWGLKLDEAKQKNLVITSQDEPEITVDNIEVAQFIYLLLHNQKIRDVIDTITSKAVLILGRFTGERKVVLDAIREELRKRNYLPILFDFEVPATRDITETISLLAGMASFVVADVTDAKSIPQELAIIVPNLPSVPVQPLLLEGSDEYGMFEHFKRYPWVLRTYRYPSSEQLIADLGEYVISPAENYRSATR